MADIKRNLIILTFVLSGTLIILLILNFQGLEKNQEAQILGIENNLNNLPTKISKGPVNSFDFRNSSNKIVFYERLDSTVYEIELDGKNKKEVARIPGASEILFSPNDAELIATIKETDGLRKSYFNLKDNKKIRLDKRIKNAAFSPDGKNLAYYFYDDGSGEGNISISNPDGSDFISIFKTRNKNLKLSWPENDLVVFYPETEDGQPLIFSIKPSGKEFQKLSETEHLIYSNQKLKKEILENLGIEASDIKLDPLENYLIFINAKDGKLYSLYQD